jgi:hypothetical protein
MIARCWRGDRCPCARRNRVSAARETARPGGPLWQPLRLAALVGITVTGIIYSTVLAAIWRWYPYPFLAVPSHGYGTVALNAVLVTVVLAVVAGAFAAGDRWLPPAPRPGGEPAAAPA